MDRILISGIRELGVHGVLPEEQLRPQPFEIDVELLVDVAAAGESDALEDTVDYSDVCDAVSRVVSSERYQLLERLASRPNGKLIAITGITPTKAGEGKTTTAVSLTEGLGFIGERSLVCLREPSVGPVLGAKGGGTGGGLAQVVPGEDINLHFTGDLHAIAAANNLLAGLRGERLPTPVNPEVYDRR